MRGAGAGEDGEDGDGGLFFGSTRAGLRFPVGEESWADGLELAALADSIPGFTSGLLPLFPGGGPASGFIVFGSRGVAAKSAFFLSPRHPQPIQSVCSYHLFSSAVSERSAHEDI